MSAEAVGWVMRHSPFKDLSFVVHLCIADSANDQHEYQFWLTASQLALKARAERRQIGRVLARLVERGFLEIVEEGGGRGKPTVYRLLFPDCAVIYETRRKSDTMSQYSGPKVRHLQRETATSVTPRSSYRTQRTQESARAHKDLNPDKLYRLPESTPERRKILEDLEKQCFGNPEIPAQAALVFDESERGDR